MLCEISISLIDRNPDQPRKNFDQAELEQLAASIERRGLLQPISVRETPDGRYEIILGERRWRACKLLNREVIQANVRRSDLRARDIDAIVENLQRADVSPLEEAHAYDRAMREHGLTPEELAAELGLKQAWRITERTNLLKLRTEYRALVACGQLGLSQAQEMSRQSERGQDLLFAAIKRGDAADYTSLRNVAQGIIEAEAQTALFGDLPEVDAADQEKATRFERRIDRLVETIGAGFDDGAIAALQRINPDNARGYADKLALIARHARMLEGQLRKAAATQLALVS